MAATPYKAINWTPNEIITEEQMDQFANNIQWVKENKPDALYTLPSGVKRYTGVKICGGRAIIPPNPKSDRATVTVNFSNFFTNQCQPLITTGVVSGHPMTFATHKGRNGLVPDNTGFEIEVVFFSESKKKKNINKSFYVTWHALGY